MPTRGVEIVVTYKCNWNCDYCLVDTHNQPLRPFKEVKEDAINLPPNTEVTLAGGETGMLPKRHLIELIEILKNKNCDLDLLTNGLFIKKHPELLDHFKEVFYHCVEYLTDDHSIEFPDLDKTKFLYVLVVVDEDLKNGALLKMMDRYPNIKFLILPDTRRSNKINLSLFMNFMKENKHRVHERTMEEFLVDIGRTWGVRDGINPYGRISKKD